jgi:aspartyl-tRNA(Asn)/glutamyl-tRNA(Gln) amidotransferase subunit B
MDYEIQWQIDLIEDQGRVQQATVLFNPDKGETRAMRSKEDAHDYRYFPDPDLPPLVIEPGWVERVRREMPELPGVMAERFERDYGLPAGDAALMTQSRACATYFEAAAQAGGPPKLVANWVMGEVARRLNAQGLQLEVCPVPAPSLGQLTARIQEGVISNHGAKQLFEALWSRGGEVDTLIEQLGLRPMNSDVLEALIDQVLSAQTKLVEEYRSGKDKAFNALVGQAMKATQGKGNPALVNELLKKKLSG